MAVGQIAKKYARILGQIEAIEQEIEEVQGIDNMLSEITRIEGAKAEMRTQLDHLAAAAVLLDPKWDRKSIVAIRPYRKVGKHGSVTRQAYIVLSESDAPMRTREIARKVASRLNREATEKTLVSLGTAIHTALKMKIGQTVTLVSEAPCRWELLPRDQVCLGPSSSEIRKRKPKRDNFPPLPRKYVPPFGHHNPKRLINGKRQEQ